MNATLLPGSAGQLSLSPADVTTGGHTALHRLGHVPGGLYQLVLAQRVPDGGGHHLGTGHQLTGCQGTLSGGADHPVLVVLVVALGGNVLSLQHQGGGAVGHGLGEAEDKVLPLPVAGVLLPDGVEDPVGSLSDLAGRTEQSLPWLLHKL